MNKNANNAIFDIMLAEALKERCISEISGSDSELPEHEFSAQFGKKIKRISRTVDRGRDMKRAGRIIRKTVLSAAAAMGIVFCLLLTQPTVFASVEKIITNSLSFYDIFMYKGDTDADSFDNSKTFGYIPKGYAIRTVIYNSKSVYQVYENGSDAQIRFKYGSAENSVITQEKYGRTAETFAKNGITYHYYGSHQYGKNTLLWYAEDCYYQLDAELEKDELVKIAENIR